MKPSEVQRPSPRAAPNLHPITRLLASHGISTQDSAEGLYEEALEIIENLFEPITGRLDKVDGLAGQTDVGEDDIADP